MKQNIDYSVWDRDTMIAARKKSIGPDKKVQKTSSVKTISKRILITGAIALAAVGITYATIKMPERQLIQEERVAYVDLVDTNAYKAEEYILYDNQKNAASIRDNLNQMVIFGEKDILIELYKMYRSMGELPDRGELTHMNEVVKHLKEMFTGNELFDRFPDRYTALIAKYGFLREDGSLDTKEFSKAMDDLLLRSTQTDLEMAELAERARGR